MLFEIIPHGLQTGSGKAQVPALTGKASQVNIRFAMIESAFSEIRMSGFS